VTSRRRGKRLSEEGDAQKRRPESASPGLTHWHFVDAAPFTKATKAIGLGSEHLAELRKWIAQNPQGVGPVIPGTGCLRKVRWVDPVRNLGKRGGLRVIYAVFTDIRTVVLLTVYGKNEREDLTFQERNTLREVAGFMHDDLKQARNLEM